MLVNENHKLTRISQNLYRNGLGTYFAIIKIRGKQIKRSLKTKDRIIAKNKLAEMENDAGRLMDDRKILFSDLAAKWQATQKGRLKEGAFARRESAIKQLNTSLGDKIVFKLTLAHLEKWQVERGNKMSARTHNIELETMNLVLKYGQDHGVLLRNPGAGKLKRRPEKNETKVVPPTRDEFATLVKEMRRESKTMKAGYFVEFLGYSGLRLDEANEVVWKDVQWTNNRLLVTGGEYKTKGETEETIPLFPPLLELLNRLKAFRPEAKPEDRLFPPRIDRKGKQQGFSARAALSACCGRAGLPDFGHHDMRHFFCANAIELGVDFKTIAGWLRHKDGGILVAKTYGHLRDDHSQEMAKKMDFSVEGIVKGSGTAGDS
jgi:integrase